MSARERIAVSIPVSPRRADREALRPGQIDEVMLPPEIAFLAAQGVPRSLLARAADMARACGSDAATALLHAGLMSEDTFYRALAAALGTGFVETPALDRGARYPQILEAGAAPLAPGAEYSVAAAPRGRAVARLLEAAPDLAPLPAITTPTRLRQAAFAHHAERIATTASDTLARHFPEWSCRPGPRPVDLVLAGLVVALCLFVTHLPGPLTLVMLAAVQALALSMLTFRLAAVTIRPRHAAGDIRLLPDRALPTYTVLVGLYREAAVVPRLVSALGRLDYPAAKLDIKFLIEADDGETAAAFAAVPLPARFEVVVVPDGLPRTKPRALNAALPLARGDLLVVYDAEDVVEPDQLRKAASLFARLPATTACLQGHLRIDNVRDNWLTRFFAIEYAALFEVLGPALAAWRMPTPLGGTSTHFRTRVLRELHGWDAWNVTEDADLGIRLALAGYHVDDLPSATIEEAPIAVKAWLRQRTRWMKGFLQTSFTHWRRPVETCRRLGPVDGLCALTLLPGTVVSALLYPLVTLGTLLDLWLNGSSVEFGLLSSLTEAGTLVVFCGGFAVMVLPAACGCLRRDCPGLLPYVPLLPFYFGLVSLAAWLAVFELARHPHRWNKTEHGLSRTSLSGALHLKRRPAAPAVRSASSVPRPSPAAAA